MKIQGHRLAMPLLGVLMWVISIHAGIFSDDSTLLPPPITGLDVPSNEIRKSVDFLDQTDMGKITQKDLNNSVNFAIQVIGYMKRLETNLASSGIKVKDKTPSHGMFISLEPDREAVKIGKEGLIALKATINLMRFCTKKAAHFSVPLDRQTCTKYFTKFTFEKTPLANSCKRLKKRCDEEEYLSKYRSVDGSCNHQEKGVRGQSFTAFARLLFPDYLDGVDKPRRSVTKKALPSARGVTGSLVKYGERPDEKLTLAVMQWSQFMEHDLARTATAVAIHTDSSIECCDQNGYTLSPRYIHPFCCPISIPSTDKAYSQKGVHCLNYVRSVPAVRPDCSFGPAEQLNQATHYLDGSQIYGSTYRKIHTLRSFINGELEVSRDNNKNYLPLSLEPTKDCQILSPDSTTCFKSGDSRVNFQPQLTVMHTLWHREHNRIARELAKINRDWDDEAVFQETRRIVIAEMQHITYNEWANVVLGRTYMNKINKFDSYDKNIDASVSNSFATAAMRALKSLYTTNLKLYDKDRQVNESISFKDYFNNPEILKQNGVLDALIRGLATQSSQKMDVYYPKDLIDNLYTNGYFGFDALSFDIQRGRDHGLPSYTKYRTLCGLKEVKSFDDFNDVMALEDIKTLSKIYDSINDVDLIVGGLLEKRDGDSLFGPTFSCIVSDQLLRTRQGDRYFYTNEQQPRPFSKAQKKEIEKVTLARIFCDNGDDIKTMQRNVFEKISLSNPLLKCNGEIPKLSFIPWMDNRERYY